MNKVRFGDVVSEVKLNVDRSCNPYAHYVAGDHMDSEDLTIHRYGNFATDDVGPAFTRIFKPGQILYGSRRTYLKKVAVASFEGICANTTFVLESKDESVFDNRLLPFVILSDKFTQWSISHSKGSTNPYVLFSDLASFEFTLPPIEEQRVLADKLWAAYKLKESYKNLLVATDEMVKSQFIEMFGTLGNPKGKIESLGTLCNIQRGGSPRPISEYITDQSDGLNWIKIGDTDDSMYITKTEEKIKPSGLKKTRQVYAGDLLLSNSMSFGRPYILKIDGCIHDGWLVLHINDATKLSPIYLCSYLSQQGTYSEMAKLAAGGVVQNLNSNIIKQLAVIVPNMEGQTKYIQILEQADKSKFELRKSIEAIDAVIKSLING